MDRAGAAEGHEHIPADVNSLLRGLDTRGGGHVLIHDVVNALGRSKHVHSQWTGHLLVDGKPGSFGI